MKAISVAILLILLTTISYAAQQAISDTGEVIILNDDGTWKYSADSKVQNEIITTNSKKFKKANDSNFLLKSTKTNNAYWINTNKWSFTKGAGNDASEYAFQLKGEDLYGMTINEGINIPLEALIGIALSNAKEAAIDTEIVDEEYRYVNGLKVIYMQMNGTIQGVKFSYFGYYYSDDSGTTQLLVYTGASMVDKYKSEINDFLNGLVTQ